MDRKVVHGVAWTAGAKVFSQAVAWSCTILVARILQPADYGLVGMAGVFLGFVQLVTELGLATAVVYLRTLSRPQLAQLNALATAVSVAAMLLTAIVAPGLAVFYQEPRVAPLMWLMSVGFLIQGLRTVPYGLTERAMDYRYLAIVEIGQGLVAGPLTLILAWLGWGYWSLPTGQLAGIGVGTAALFLREPIGFSVPRASAMREAIALSYHLVVARISWYAYSNADYVVVGRRLGATELGAYTLGFTIASAPVDKITALLVRVTRPVFAAVQSEPAELKRIFLHTSSALAFVTVPASVGLAALAPELIAVVFGAQWAAAALPLMLLALCTPVRSLAPLLPQILNATGDSRFAMRLNLVAAVVLPLGFIIGSFAGTAGVAAAWVLLYPVIVTPLAVRVARRIGLSGREYLSATGPAILGSVLMGLAVCLVRAGLPGSWSPVLRLALLAVFGVAIFSGVMLTLFRTRTKEYIAALKTLRGS